MKKQTIYIILTIIISSLAMSYVDAFIRPEYVFKSFIKFILFLVIPLIYCIFNRDEIKNFKRLFNLKKDNAKKSIVIGAVIYAVILTVYFMTRDFIDYSSVTAGLGANHGVTKNNFLYVSLYISLMNSFLEEFFFRGFGFITLKKKIGRKASYIFSSAMFAFYHTGMLAIMFDLWILPIIFAGLFVGGCLFNYLNENSESIYTSWTVHMFANFGINTVGFILFGII